MAIYKSDIVDINLETGSIYRSFNKHSIGTADEAADRFGVRVFRNGEAVDLSGCSCYGYFQNSQGTNIALTSAGTVDGNVAYVTLPQACYNYEGNFCLAIKLLISGVTSTVRIVDGVVDNTNTGSAVAPTSAVPTYSEILEQYDAMVAATAVANGAIATTFNAATVYPAGSYVINSGALYRITADHAANVTWANTSKVATNFGAEVQGLKSALKTNSLTSFYGSEKVIGNGIISLDDVGYWKTTANNGATEFIYLSYYRSAKVPCSPGDVFVINTYGAGGNYRAWAFIDSSNNIVTRCEYAYANDEIVTAPATAVYLLINNNLNNRATGYYAFKNQTTIKNAVDQIKNDTNSMIYYQALTSSDDINSLTRSGFYAWGSSNVPQNSPLRAAACRLLNMYVSNVNITQILLPGAGHDMMWRYRTSADGWLPWKTIGDISITNYIDNYEIPEIRNALGEQTSIVDNITIASGYYWNNQTNTAVKTAISSYNCSEPIPVNAGERYTITMYSASSSKQAPVLIVDSNYLILQSFVGTRNANNTFEFEIPENASYILLTTNSGHSLTDKLKQVLLISPSETTDELEQEINEIREAIGTVEKDITSSYDSGYYWDSQTSVAVKTAYTGYIAYQEIEVSPGDNIHIRAYYAHSKKQHAAIVVDSEYNILQRYGGTHDSNNDYYFVVPENASYILMTTRASSTCTCYKQELNTILNSPGTFDFKGKNIAIIGDSISTNGNWSESNPLGNVPEIVIQSEDVGVELSAYATYYDIGITVGGHEIVAADVGTEITFTPVEDDIGKIVGKPKNNNAASVVTWWEVAQERLGFNPIPVCWSGASITSHEGTDSDYKTSYAWHPAQIRKCGIRTPGTMTRTAPDMIIIYRGTNDFSHAPYSQLTADYFGYPWTYPNTDVITGGYGFKEGLCLTIRKLREAYPSAQIVLSTCNFFKRVNYSSYPINNGEYTENQLNDAIREVADWMGCKLIEFDKDGLTYENASSMYYQDSSAYTHPTTAGHRIMGNRALRDMGMMNNMA